MKTLSRRHLVCGGSALALASAWRPARAAQTIPIGVLEDLNGPYSEIAGPGSVGGSKLAVEDFQREHPDIAVEVIAADMQTKADLALGLSHELFDVKDVDMVLGFPSSAAALAVTGPSPGEEQGRADHRCRHRRPERQVLWTEPHPLDLGYLRSQHGANPATAQAGP